LAKGQPVVIRDAREEDLDAAADIIRAAYAEYSTVWGERLWLEYIRDAADVRSRLNETELIIADRAGELVGTVTFYPEAAHSREEGWPQGWAGVRLLAVLPGARGARTGRLLMEECVRRARVQGTHVLGLHTSEAMAIAKAMYERMGFVRVPSYDFSPGEGPPVLAYRLDLDAA
jgi:ribosomal protein S18 acetylase RimI-like enzyme